MLFYFWTAESKKKKEYFLDFFLSCQSAIVHSSSVDVSFLLRWFRPTQDYLKSGQWLVIYCIIRLGNNRGKNAVKVPRYPTIESSAIKVHKLGFSLASSQINESRILPNSYHNKPYLTLIVLQYKNWSLSHKINSS